MKVGSQLAVHLVRPHGHLLDHRRRHLPGVQVGKGCIRTATAKYDA